ncbi:negative regulator GrlR [Escherichia coli]|nr:negative regulator GrlR [Escherichia coli]EEU4184319.1 negative regulator GrlR [Escherichia coli]EFA3477409.1 negative regulator GrlR [Escherichia coli]
MIMKDGIYSIIFISNEDSCGEGILIKNGNLITGGDIASVYQGVLSEEEDIILHVHRYNHEIPSVLNIEQDYQLVIPKKVLSNDSNVTLHCHVRGNEKLFVDVYARFIEPLIIKNTEKS